MTNSTLSTKFEVVVIGVLDQQVYPVHTHWRRRASELRSWRGKDTRREEYVRRQKCTSSPLEKVYENFRKEAPIERWVKHERMSMMADDGTFSLDYDSKGVNQFHDLPLKACSLDEFQSGVSGCGSSNRRTG